MTFQNIIIAGNLGADPELRHFPDGSPVCNFSLATNRVYVNRATQEQVKETTWFRVSVTGAQAESAHTYLKKGSGALCMGRMRQDKQTGGPRLWTGQDGLVRASYELSAFVCRFLGGGNGNNEVPGDVPADIPASQVEGQVGSPPPINVGTPVQQAVPGAQYPPPPAVAEDDEIPF